MNNQDLSSAATALFDKMQQILEARELPIVEAHPNDFYEIDKSILSSKFSEDSHFLWLLHPSGTHLGRIGVLPTGKDLMASVLLNYKTAHPLSKMELYSIAINGKGESTIQEISMDQGQKLTEKRDFKMSGPNLSTGGVDIASIQVTIQNKLAGGRYADTFITSLNDHKLTRSETIAATMCASNLVVEKSDFFTPIGKMIIDGVDAARIIPLLNINEPQRGLYGIAYLDDDAHQEDVPDVHRQRAG